MGSSPISSTLPFACGADVMPLHHIRLRREQVVSLRPFFFTSHPDSADVHHGYLFVIRMLWPWVLTRLQNGMPTNQTHLLHRSLENAQNASGFVAVVVCKQDLWSWIAAILQDSMLSVVRHLIHTFIFFMFYLG